MNKKILIIGSGFLSRHVSDVFSNSKNEVFVLYHNHDLPKFKCRQEKVSKNIYDYALEFQPNYILFAKGNSLVKDNNTINQSIKENVTPIAVALEQLYENLKNLKSLEKIIIIGSAAEYAKGSEALKEESSLYPSSIYGLSKVFLYNTSMYYYSKGLPIVYVRQFNAIGPWQRKSFVLSAFASRLIEIERGAEAVLNVGDLSCQRDFIDGRDAARAYKLIFEKGNTGEVYNIGSGNITRIQHLLDTAIKESGVTTAVKIVNRQTINERNKLNNILLSDNRKIIELGFKFRYTLVETIKDTLKFWRNNV